METCVETFKREYPKLFAQEKLILEFTELLSHTLCGYGVTKKELAKRLGKSKKYIKEILNGERDLKLTEISDIFHALNWSVVLDIEEN